MAELVDFTHRKEQMGQVDSLEQLQDDRVFLFSGEADTVVDPKVSVTRSITITIIVTAEP